MTTASVCTIGDEILIGQIVDTNSSAIARALQDCGIKVEDMVSIGDDRRAIINTLKRELKKNSIVIATGGLGPTKDDITKAALARLSGSKGYVVHPGQLAVVHDILASRGFSLVEIRLETGRTHQIRAQFSHRGMPLAGDRKYSKYPDPKDWQIALWSSHLSFTHPETGQAMDFRLPPPETEPWTFFAEASSEQKELPE